MTLETLLNKTEWNADDIIHVSDTMIEELGEGGFITEFLQTIPMNDYVKYLKLMISQEDRANRMVVEKIA